MSDFTRALLGGESDKYRRYTHNKEERMCDKKQCSEVLITVVKL